MDKDIVYFLISESRILAQSNTPNDEVILNEARLAIMMGDRLLKIIEVEVTLGLPGTNKDNTSVITIKTSKDISNDPRFTSAFSHAKLDLQTQVWDTMPAGIYRVKKSKYDGKESCDHIEYCPDVDDGFWESIECKGWNSN